MEDEEVCESWEEAADSGEIERRLEAKLKISQKTKKSTIASGSSPIRTAMVIQDESQPAAPPPQIRILKRPSSNGSLGSTSSSNRPTQQPKSLAQREAEYAEARRRILGSASSEETPQDKPSQERPVRVNAQPQPEPVRPNNHLIRQPTGPDGTIGFRHCR
ncbi:SUZ domain-containing protein 1-like [Salvelinus fontinalis]|uniref:SUZ domain-containing protein 1-like n=1 Tax=Salvelinus fontinalis TaxID=8038 RepID=UPI00248597AC|nr:SUZ domain-containing protein 1-like [Salvelinus fontinalis]